MSMMRINLIVAGVVVALTTSFTFGLLVPGLKSLRKEQSQLDHNRAEVRMRQETIGDLGGLYSELVELKDNLSDFHQRLPADKAFGDFLRDISQAFAECKIEGYIIQPGNPRELGAAAPPSEEKQSPTMAAEPNEIDVLVQGTRVLPVHVTCETTFPSLFEFLTKLESLPRLNHVDRMIVLNVEGRPGTIKVEIDLHTFQRPE